MHTSCKCDNAYGGGEERYVHSMRHLKAVFNENPKLEEHILGY